MKIQFNGVELEVDGEYTPFRYGFGRTPDEKEEIEIQSVKFSGVEVFDLLDGLMKNGQQVIRVLEELALEERNRD